jgi:hypothetical protein
MPLPMPSEGEAMTKLRLHYEPGFIAVFKRHDYPGWGRCTIQHGGGEVFTVVSVKPVSNDDAEWCLKGSWIPRHSAQLDTRAVS